MNTEILLEDSFNFLSLLADGITTMKGKCSVLFLWNISLNRPIFQWLSRVSEQCYNSTVWNDSELLFFLVIKYFVDIIKVSDFKTSLCIKMQSKINRRRTLIAVGDRGLLLIFVKQEWHVVLFRNILPRAVHSYHDTNHTKIKMRNKVPHVTHGKKSL